MGRVQVAVAAVCTGIALAGCGGQAPPASQPPAQQPTTTTEVGPSGPTSGRVAPPAAVTVPEQLKFTTKTVDGKDFSGESLAGKPAVLWFWAPWCPKCRGEAPGVAETVKSAGGTVTFVGVAARDEVPNMRKFVEQHKLGDFVHLADTDLAIWKRFGVAEQPAYAFITKDGTVEVVTARVGKDELMRRAQALAG
jgi:thiol-disulfide isomerase/thioredoxin